MSDDTIIEVRHLTARYGTNTILEDVSFTIPKGEIFLIVGGSGCGKSTLLKHMIGLLKPYRGEVFIHGHDINTDDPGLRRQITSSFGVLYQSGALFGAMTLRENIGLALEEFTDYPPDLIRSVADVKLGLVGLAGYGDYLPSELSGGMKKRAGLARAMAMEPDILFFDEPSSGLDPITAADLDQLILQIRDTQQTTMVIVSHDLASIYEIADRVIMLDPWRRGVIAEGKPADLKDHPHQNVRHFFQRVSSRRNPLESGS